MNKDIVELIFPILFLLFIFTVISGCVEVTPPVVESQTPTPEPTVITVPDVINTGDKTVTSIANDTDNNTESSTTVMPDDSAVAPDPKLPNPPTTSFTEVAPISTIGLKNTPVPQYSKLYNRNGLSVDQEFFPVYHINRTFANDAVAYAYDLRTPPMAIELDFVPKMTKDIIAIDKRTGDKEGMVEYVRDIPVQSAWFELRVYNRETGEEILTEGYGRKYSLENKTVTIQRVGDMQFDMLGDDVYADITMKLAINNATIKEYGDVINLIQEEKIAQNLLPKVFLTESDLSGSWKKVGDTEHDDSHYSSMFSTDTGQSFTQKIYKYETADETKSAYDNEKSEISSSEKITPLINGNEGFSYSTSFKTGVVFMQGNYLVELTSFSYPAVNLDEFKTDCKKISERISALV